MEPKDFRKTAKDLVRAVGKKEAVRLMVMAGASPSVADKLARNVYPSEIGLLLGRAIEEALTEANKRSAS